MDTTPSKLEPRRPAPSRRMRRKRHLHKAFTLVELLVVMVVLAILAGLITGAVIRARITARNAVIKMEISDLATALESYKAEVGEYPPDFTGVGLPPGDPLGDAARARVVAHLRKRFPRYAPPMVPSPTAQFPNAPYYQFIQDVWLNNYSSCLPPITRDQVVFDPASALAFWLGGLPQNAALDPTTLAGFHADVERPFRAGMPRKTPFLEFKREQIFFANGTMRFIPTGLINTPYVYFRATRNPVSQQYDYAINGVQLALGIVGAGVCVPYRDGTAPGLPWRDLNKYQIICAGLDERFGSLLPPPNGNFDPTVYRFSRTGDNLAPEDMDNITSFAENRLEAELP